MQISPDFQTQTGNLAQKIFLENQQASKQKRQREVQEYRLAQMLEKEKNDLQESQWKDQAK